MQAPVYICGPMALRYPQRNAKAFYEGEKVFLEFGIQYVNSRSLLDPRLNHDQQMQVFLASLSFCKSIALLPGWEQEEHCRLEVQRASDLGITIYSPVAMAQYIRDRHKMFPPDPKVKKLWVRF